MTKLQEGTANIVKLWRNRTSFWNSPTHHCTWYSSLTSVCGQLPFGCRYFYWCCSLYCWFSTTPNRRMTSPGIARCISYRISSSPNCGTVFSFGESPSVGSSTRILHTFVSTFLGFSSMDTLSNGIMGNLNLSARSLLQLSSVIFLQQPLIMSLFRQWRAPYYIVSLRSSCGFYSSTGTTNPWSLGDY